MIEINLLPDNSRQTEGTPPKRFALYIVWLICALLLGSITGKYWSNYIPTMNAGIKTAKIDKERLEKEKKEVDEIKGQIGRITEKNLALENLMKTRVRFGRILDRLADSAPEGVWFRGLTVVNEPGSTKYPTPGGKMYKIQLSCYAMGATQLDSDRKVGELLGNIERLFNVAPYTAPLGVQPQPEYGFSPFLGVRFHPTRATDISYENLPAMQPDVAKQVKAESLPKQGTRFQLSLVFELPAAK